MTITPGTAAAASERLLVLHRHQVPDARHQLQRRAQRVANEPARKSGRSYSPAASRTPTPASSGQVGRLLGLALLQLKRQPLHRDHPRRSGGALAFATAGLHIAAVAALSAASAAPSGQQPLERVQARRGRDQQQRARSRRRNCRHPQRHRAAERDPHEREPPGASASTTPRVLRPGPTAASPNPGRSGVIARNPGSGSTSDHIERSATPACCSTSGGPTPTSSYSNVTARDATPPSSRSASTQTIATGSRRRRVARASPARERTGRIGTTSLDDRAASQAALRPADACPAGENAQNPIDSNARSRPGSSS